MSIEKTWFLRELHKLVTTYDAEVFVNDESEIRINLFASNEESMPDERGHAIFLGKSFTSESFPHQP